jgi:hypothetical protein
MRVFVTPALLLLLKNAQGLDVSCGFGEVQRQTRQAVMFVAV